MFIYILLIITAWKICLFNLLNEVGSEEGICALLLEAFVKIVMKIQKLCDNLDLGYISAESRLQGKSLKKFIKLFEAKSKEIRMWKWFS